MSDDVQHLVDFDERELAQVPLGRNRFLRTLGIALFGLAAHMMTPKTVYAAAPPGCNGPSTCSSCPGQCPTTAYCKPYTYNCWYVCYNFQTWQCCDYKTGCSANCSGCSDFCVCRFFVADYC
jgi:hypothetical protein